MARPPLLPRMALHLLNAFIVIAVLLIFFFPTLGYTKSVYRPGHDSSTIIGDAVFPGNTASQNNWVNIQRNAENVAHKGASVVADARTTMETPSRISVLNVISSTFRVVW